MVLWVGDLQASEGHSPGTERQPGPTAGLSSHESEPGSLAPVARGEGSLVPRTAGGSVLRLTHYPTGQGRLLGKEDVPADLAPGQRAPSSRPLLCGKSRAAGGERHHED